MLSRLNQVLRSKKSSAKNHRLTPQCLKKRRRRLEKLEARSLLAANLWLSPSSGNWFDDSNWSDGVPTADDDVVISGSGSPFTVTINNSASTAVANSVTINSADATLANDRKNLTVTDSFTVDAGTVLWGTRAIEATSVVNHGQIVISANGSIDADTVTQNGLLRYETVNSNISATISGSVTNQGTIQVVSPTAARNVSIQLSDSLTNVAGARIEFLAGVGGNHSINGDIQNEGTITIESNLNLGSTTVLTNESLIQVDAASSLTTGSSGSTATINQVSGILDIDGTFDIQSGSFQFVGGRVEGTV
ncbi:MAG: hypothetical protein AAF497_28355, partial [Planctomycetota bacterium]